MITRIGHGRTKVNDADASLKYVQETGLKDNLATPGNISAKILRRIVGDLCHFYTLTEGKDLESVKRFAGDEYEKAKYYPEDKKYLLEPEEMVEHYETYF